MIWVSKYHWIWHPHQFKERNVINLTISLFIIIFSKYEIISLGDLLSEGEIWLDIDGVKLNFNPKHTCQRQLIGEALWDTGYELD